MTTYRRAVTPQLAVLLFVLGAAPLVAQSTATILGVVRDSGGVLPGATVTVRNVDTGLTRSVPTGGDGAFRFPAFAVGHVLCALINNPLDATQHSRSAPPFGNAVAAMRKPRLSQCGPIFRTAKRLL